MTNCMRWPSSGLVERQRKLDAATLFWTLVLGFAVGDDRSIDALQFVGGEFACTTGTMVVRSSERQLREWSLTCRSRPQTRIGPLWMDIVSIRPFTL